MEGGPFWGGAWPPPWNPHTRALAPNRQLHSLSDLLDQLDLPQKRKVFVSYHHHGDQGYKDALVKLYCDEYELLEDNSLERIIDTDDLKYVEREIREDYIKGASVTVVLSGSRTWERKFVDWEIYATLLKQAGLVAIQLPSLAPNPLTGTVTVSARLHDNIQTGYAVWKTWAETSESTESSSSPSW